MNQQVISVIVPTYKEAQNIPVLVEKIDRNMKMANIGYEIIVVDDDSNDGIIETVDSLRNDYNICLKVRKNQRGLSSAVIAGFEAAKSDILVVMDADLSHPAEKIPELVEQIIVNNYDLVIGSRFVEGGSIYRFNLYRKLNALISRLLVRPLTKVKDPLAGFFALRREVLVNNLNPLGFKIGLEIIVKCKPNQIAEIPIEFQQRLFGKSKLSIKEQIKYLLHISRLYEYKFTTLSEIIRFCVIGCIGMIIDLCTTYIAKEIILLQFQIARAVGLVFALTNNFFLNRRFTFTYAKHGNIVLQYMSFITISALGFLVNWSISVYLYQTNPFFNTHYLLASFFGILGGFVVNFTGNKFITFKSRREVS